MIRRFAFAALILPLMISGLCFADMNMPAKPVGGTEPLFEGLGQVHHPVTTKSPRAQKYFDQGLAFVYGFNHDEAESSFKEAAKIDPGMPMAYWGIALVLGPNYNLPGDKERGKRAAEAVSKAKSLEAGATAEERDLIEAVSKRYGSDGSVDPAHDKAYAGAMREVAHRYPDDPDVQTLFAESLMDLNPWALWTSDGTPGPNTVEIVTTLEGVIAKHPQHIGANHYYIHAVEASPHPDKALPSADRLGALAPTEGHLVHMPSHIYIRTGRYDSSAKANAAAIKADKQFIEKTGEQGVYPMMYYTHNIQFLCYSQMMEGRRADAVRTARELQAQIPVDAVRAMPGAEFLVPQPYFTMARFGEWDAILKEPAPSKDLVYTTGMWHYTRGLAFSAKGRPDDAEAELKQVDGAAAATPADRIVGVVSHARELLQLASAILAGQITADKGDHNGAIDLFTKAVAMEDALPYEEPPAWYFPVRESLGAELLAAGKLNDAEAVYREDLRKNPENPRSLHGLAGCLKAEGKTPEATEVERRFDKAWSHADIKPAPLKVAAAQ